LDQIGSGLDHFQTEVRAAARPVSFIGLTGICRRQRRATGAVFTPDYCDCRNDVRVGIFTDRCRWSLGIDRAHCGSASQKCPAFDSGRV